MKKLFKSLMCVSSLILMCGFLTTNNIGVKAVDTQSMPLSDPSAKSPDYYTVKNLSSLRQAIAFAHSGDIIIVTGDIILNSENIEVTNGRQITIMSDGKKRTIKGIGKICVSSNSILNLNLDNKQSDDTLTITEDIGIIIKDSTLNMYSGVSIKNINYNKFNGNSSYNANQGSIIDCHKSKFNIYGGNIVYNTVPNSLIGSDSINDSEINMYGGSIANNKGICHGGVYYISYEALISANIFNMYGGKIENNANAQYVVCAQNCSIAGGRITNNSCGVCSNKLLTITGGMINNNSKTDTVFGKYDIYCAGGDTLISGDVILGKIKLRENKKVIIDKNIANKYPIVGTIVLDGYKPFNSQKVLEVSNGVNMSDVFQRFNLENKLFYINNKGYVDDAPSQKFEYKDENTGISVTSDSGVFTENVVIKMSKIENISDIKNSTFCINKKESDGSLSVYSIIININGKKAEAANIKGINIYVPHVGKNLDITKLSDIKVYNSDNEESTSYETELKSIDKTLYTRINIK